LHSCIDTAYAYEMFQWDDLRVFLALGALGTQKAAARSLKVDQATVGRRIKDLERQLGTKLFDKRSDGFVLTVAGEKILESAKQAEGILLNIERGTAALDQRPEGVLRVTMPGGMANHWLMPRLRDFFRQYPAIKLEFLTGPEVVNLWKREADVAIRLVEPTQRDLYFKKIGELRLAFYQVTKSESAFVGLYDWAMSAAERRLLEKVAPPARVLCRSAAWSSVYYGIKAGMGHGILPSFFAEKDSSLIERKEMPSVKTPVWLVMHPDVKGSGRVKAFVEFLATMESSSVKKK